LRRSNVPLGADEDSATRGPASHDTEPEIDASIRKPNIKAADSHRRDNTREAEDSRRTTGGRSTRPSWLRNDDDGNEIQLRDNNKNNSNVENLRSRVWRTGEKNDRPTRNGTDRDWVRDGRIEHEPEWMEELSSEQKREKHSVQDMEEWKASMKAREVFKVQTEPVETLHTRTASGTSQNKVKPGVPLSVDPALDDRFLSFFSDTTGKRSAETKGVEEGSKTGPVRGNQKLSKFTGFFTPQVATTPADTEPTINASKPQPQPPPEPVNEDKEGFQRILQMLGAPQGSANVGVDSKALPSSLNSQPSLFSTSSPPPILSPRSRKSHGLEGLLGLQSPKEAAVPMNKDSEFLLNLLRPKDNFEYQSVDQMQRRAVDKPSHIPQTDNFQAEAFRGPPQHYEMDSNRARYLSEEDLLRGRYLDKHAVPANHSHAPNRPIQFDDSDDGSVFPPQFTLGIPSQQSHPPGLHRPPGFDLPAPPPGFGQFVQAQQPQQRGSGAVCPPPGFAGPQIRNANHQQFPPGLMPNLANLALDERGPPFNTRHMVHGIGGVPGPGSQGGPPPGFHGLHGPPPGNVFPSMMGIPPEGLYGPGRNFSDLGEAGSFRGTGRGGNLAGYGRRQE
jgi:hypothetical protein